MNFVKEIWHRYQFYVSKKKWRKKNKRNDTFLVHNVNVDCIEVGDYSYGPLNVIQSSEGAKLIIGKYCSIAEAVTFILNSDHPLDRFSTYPFKNKLGIDKHSEAQTKGDIFIEDDVWIGYGALIMSGVHIGRGAVIGAGAIVTSDIAPYAIAVGIPARIVKYRFEPYVRQRMMEVDYSLINEKFVRDNIEILYCSINADTLKEIEKRLEEEK